MSLTVSITVVDKATNAQIVTKNFEKQAVGMDIISEIVQKKPPGENKCYNLFRD